MKSLDLEKELSEQKLTTENFLRSYNKDLPPGFPRASLVFLREFQKTYPGLFKNDHLWSLDRHRKRFMDWLPQHKKSLNL